MRTLRRMVASIGMVAILSTLVVSNVASAQSFTDVAPGAYFYNSVEALVSGGVVSTQGGVYNPGANAERGLAAGYVVLAVPYSLVAPTTPTFADVPTTHPYYQYVETAALQEIVSGYAGTNNFGPNDTLTRGQFAKMVVEGFGFPEYIPSTPTFADVMPGMWEYPFVETAAHNGVINGFMQNGVKVFAPNNTINRADLAVMTYQAQNPTVGPTPVTPPVSCELEGGAGSIADADFISGLTGEEVGEKAEDVEVAGLKIEADDGSDIELMALRLDFTQGTADQDFEDYATEVSVWFDGEEIARVDADEFNDDNNYDKTLTLDSCAIIRAGETGELVVAVSGVSNLDTLDIGETWTVEFENVRFGDASGAIITDSDTGDINGVTRTFSFESFATSSDTELKIALKKGAEADAINKAHMINVHATNRTNNVKILAFTLEAEGTSDMNFNEFGVDLVTSAADVDDVIAGGTSPAVRLIIDGDEYGTASYNEAAANNREILFDDIDYVLEAGETVDAYIEVDFLAVSGALTEGDTILAQITAAQTADTALVDVRDATNSQIDAASITGTAVGQASQLYDVTFDITSDGWSHVKTSSDTATIDESVSFTLSFTVTAKDGTVYIDDGCTEDTTPAALAMGTGFNFFATNEADSAVTCAFTTSATPGVNGNYIVEEGTPETFYVTLNAVADVASDFVQVTWEGLNWSEADEAGDRMYEGQLDQLYKSASVFINTR